MVVMAWADKRDFWAVDLGFLMPGSAHPQPLNAARAFEATLPVASGARQLGARVGRAASQPNSSKHFSLVPSRDVLRRRAADAWARGSQIVTIVAGSPSVRSAEGGAIVLSDQDNGRSSIASTRSGQKAR